MKTNVSRLRLLLAQYQDYARDTEAKGPTALKGKFDWEEYLAHNDAQLEKAAEVCEELISVIKCENEALNNTKRHIEIALINTIRHLTEVRLDMLPFKGQCDECKYKNDHPSARLGEQYEDKGSSYAAEGTEAHTLCEYKLKTALGIRTKDPTTSLAYYSEEMEECANGYAAYIMELVETAKQNCADPVVLIEQRLDFSKYVEGGFGTGDCVIIADGTLNVIDFKMGAGILIAADDNPQMKLYALGALELFDGIYDIDTVSMTIYQPRRDNISTHTVFKESLYQWAAETLKPIAELAYDGEGEFRCGDWCQFCKAKHDCRKRR